MRGHIRRPLEERRNQWVDRRMRAFNGEIPRFECEDEVVSLRNRIRDWERDEQRKMEQERLASQGHGRHLDYLIRGDQQSVETETDQAADEDHSVSPDQNRLHEGQCVDRLGEDVDGTCCLNLDIQGDELMGKVTHDRMLDESRV
jgi:hypothetical protein